MLFFLTLSCARQTHRSTASIDGTKLLLISDIDDTIKVTGLLSKRATAYYGARTGYPFAGLPELYRFFACNQYTDGPEKEKCLKYRSWTRTDDRLTAYVTGAPGKAQMLGNYFLARNHFPIGPVEGRVDMNTTTLKFKVSKIKEIIEAFPDYQIILVGDNGEADVLVYEEIQKQYRTRIQNTYIHYAYDKNLNTHAKLLTSGQTPYLGGFDLAIHFFNEGYISREDLKIVLKSVLTILENRNNIFNEHMIAPRFFGPACKAFMKDKSMWPKIKTDLLGRNLKIKKLVYSIKKKINRLEYCMK